MVLLKPAFPSVRELRNAATLATLLTVAMASGETNGGPFSAEGFLSLHSSRFWRGMEMDANVVPALGFGGTVAWKGPNLFFTVDGDLALLMREDPWQNRLGDQVRFRLDTRHRFPGDRVELAGGARAYLNPARNPGAYGFLTPELFLRIEDTGVALHPSLQIDVDLTPNQTGVYWAVDIRKELTLLKQPLDLAFHYGHANGFMKQGDYQFLKNLFTNPLYALQDLFPTDLAASLTWPWRVAPHVHLENRLALNLAVDPYLNRNAVTVNLSVTAHVGTEKDRFHRRYP